MKMFLALALAAFVILPGKSFAQAPHEVDLTCTPGSGGGQVTGFNFKRGTVKGGPYSTISSPTICTLNDVTGPVGGFVEGSHLFYVVTATGPGGESQNSNEFDALIPFSKPSAPALSGVVK